MQASIWNAVVNNYSDESLSELTDYAIKYTWNGDDSQIVSRSILSNLAKVTNHPNILELLSHSLAAIEPGAALLQHFDIFERVLTKSNDLKQIELALGSISTLFKVHVPSNTEYEDRIVSAAARFVDLYMSQVDNRWNHLEQAIGEQLQVDYTVGLDPGHDSKLENAIFCFGMANPLVFYDLLNKKALTPATRLSAFLLLKSFIVLEDSPVYYLAESSLHETIFKSALYDTEACTKLTSASLLTIILPILNKSSLPLVGSALKIIVDLIRWGIDMECLLTNLASPDKMSIEDVYVVDEALNTLSVESIKRIVTRYFAVVYGMFPCNVMKYLQSNVDTSMTILIRGTFEVREDPLNNYREALSNSLDWKSMVRAIIIELFQKHRYNPKSFGLNSESELQNPWFATSQAPSISIFCEELYIDQSTHGKLDVAENVQNLKSVTETILKINKYLYGPAYQLNSSICTESNYHLHAGVVLKIFYLIVINESFFKESMRQYHVVNVKTIRKLDLRMRQEDSALRNFKLDLEKSQEESTLVKKSLVSSQFAITELEKRYSDNISGLESQLSQTRSQIQVLSTRLDDALTQERVNKLKIAQVNDRLFESLEKIRHLEILASKYYTYVESRTSASVFNYHSATKETSNSQPAIQIFESMRKEKRDALVQASNMEQKLLDLESRSIATHLELEQQVTAISVKLLKATDTIQVQANEIQLLNDKLNTAEKIIGVLHAKMLH